MIGAVALFGVIGVLGWFKREPKPKVEPSPLIQEIAISGPKESKVVAPVEAPKPRSSEDLPEADRIHQLFARDSSKFPFVETVSYTSRVPWMKDRPAWIADYAAHYETSRHFIARSLNKKADYFTQKVGPGDKFNVFKKDKQVQFHLLIDLSRSKMWFYAFDVDGNERILLKTYKVGLGRLDSQKTSGYLTPIGKYELGEKVAIYKPGSVGFFQNEKMEMIRIFGTRWIPFEKELEKCTEPAKGLGLHGAPWMSDPVSGQLVEDRSKIGKYDSDGCIRLAQEDIEEIFSVVITKPTQVQLVRDFHDAELPGVER